MFLQKVGRPGPPRFWRPCCLQPSCNYCQYCMLLLVSLFFKQRCTNDLNLEWMDQYFMFLLCQKSRVQSFGCNILWHIVVYCNCDIIAILKIMRCNNCSSTLLLYCVNIELLPSPKSDYPADGCTKSFFKPTLATTCITCYRLNSTTCNL